MDWNTNLSFGIFSAAWLSAGGNIVRTWKDSRLLSIDGRASGLFMTGAVIDIQGDTVSFIRGEAL